MRQTKPAWLQAEVNGVVARMCDRGAALQRTNRSNTTQWRLTDGTSVSGLAARLIIVRPDIAGVGDSLLADLSLSQTFRFISSNHGGKNV